MTADISDTALRQDRTNFFVGVFHLFVVGRVEPESWSIKPRLTE